MFGSNSINLIYELELIFILLFDFFLLRQRLNVFTCRRFHLQEKKVLKKIGSAKRKKRRIGSESFIDYARYMMHRDDVSFERFLGAAWHNLAPLCMICRRRRRGERFSSAENRARFTMAEGQ